jgi:chromosomal replication initiation ATPase DnaA
MQLSAEKIWNSAQETNFAKSGSRTIISASCRTPWPSPPGVSCRSNSSHCGQLRRRPARPRAAKDQKPPKPPHERASASGEIHFNPKNTFDIVRRRQQQQFRLRRRQGRRRGARQILQPAFLYGGVGLGKTHLLHAIGQHVPATKKGARVATSRPKNSPTNTLTASRTTSSPSSAKNTARPTCC